ncbi:MAG: GxxExxY protein [Acidobacteriota bacterium]|nr:GxxExxY protein [Acidobacteriota bacterium]
MYINQLTKKVIGLAIKVHRKLGPGFLESVYKAALAYELSQAGIPFEKEKEMPVPYGSIILQVGFRCDFLIESQLIVECKAVKQLHPIDHAQTLNYLKSSNLQVGLLFNFHVMKLVDGGLKRIVNGFDG